MARLIITLFALALACAGQQTPVEQPKPPAISDAAKASAWKAQALVGVAQTALQATKEYKEWEKRQTELQEQLGVLQAACGKEHQVSWTPDDISCAPKPAPKPEEKK